MKIKILGTRGEIAASHPKYLMHSGILVDGKILLDVGEKEFLKHNPQFIFITHLHPDHAFFMASGFEIITDALVFGPELSGSLKRMNVLSETVEATGDKLAPIPV